MLFLLRKLLALFVYFDIYNSTALVQYHCTFSFLYDVVLININKNSPYLQKRGNTCYVNDDLCTHLDQNTNMFCQNCNLHIYYLFNMQYFEKGHLSCRESKKFFFCFSWGMKALMPMSQNPWSDFFHLLNSRFYSHPKFKIVKIEANFWEGPPQLF